MSSALYLPVSGLLTGFAALLVFAGAGKLYDAARGGGDGSSVQAALRLAPGPWRVVQTLAGLVECATGLAVCFGVHPGISGTAMAAQGAVFVGLLVHIRRAGIAGDCGCVRRPVSKAPGGGARQVAAKRAVLRAALLLLAGVAEAVVRIPAPTRAADAPAWVGALLTFAVLVSIDLQWRTRRCRRPLWLPLRQTINDLRSHGAYQAMAASAGPLTGPVSYRRAGCVDEFWFAAGPESRAAGRLVAVRVSRTGPSGALAVRASIEAAAPRTGTRVVRAPGIST
jgi:hypothetical protein